MNEQISGEERRGTLEERDTVRSQARSKIFTGVKRQPSCAVLNLSEQEDRQQSAAQRPGVSPLKAPAAAPESRLQPESRLESQACEDGCASSSRQYTHSHPSISPVSEPARRGVTSIEVMRLAAKIPVFVPGVVSRHDFA
jgi:hypothetical protein